MPTPLNQVACSTIRKGAEMDSYHIQGVTLGDINWFHSPILFLPHKTRACHEPLMWVSSQKEEILESPSKEISVASILFLLRDSDIFLLFPG